MPPRLDREGPIITFVAGPEAPFPHAHPAGLRPAPIGSPLNPLSLSLAQNAQFRLEAAGFDLAVGALRTMSPDRASELGGRLWRRFAPLNKRHTRARAHLQQAFPEKSETEIDALLDSVWDNLGRTSAEAFHLPRMLAERDRFEIRPGFIDAVERSKARGGVLVSLHLGNWEFGSPLIHEHGLPVCGVYQRIHNPLIDARIMAERSPYFVRGLFTKSSDTARKLLRVAADGGAVTMLADLREITGAAVPFFGRPAPSTMFPAVLARSRDLPLFAGAVARREGATFEVDMVEIEVPRTADREADLVECTAALQRQFEAFIRRHPGQWMWGHRRWER